MPHVSRGLARLLHGFDTIVAAHSQYRSILLRVGRLPNVLESHQSRRDMLSARFSQAHGYGRSVFHCLCRSLYAGWQNRMRRITKKRYAAVIRDPSWQRITIYQLPVHCSTSTDCSIVYKALRTTGRSLLNDSLAHWIPAFYHSVDILHLSWQRPRLIDILIVFVSQDPTAIRPILDCRK